MTQTKLIRLLNEYLTRLGDITVVELIDYYYTDETNERLGWKVRKSVTLSQLIAAEPIPSDFLYGQSTNMRDVLKHLEKDPSNPVRINVKYSDSYDRWMEGEEERKRKWNTEYDAWARAAHLFYPMPHDIYTFENKFRY